MKNERNRMINVPSKSKCSSKYKGVCFAKFFKKWKADIQVNKKVYHLGYYENELDAAKAYNDAALKYFGEFACINIIEENDK